MPRTAPSAGADPTRAATAIAPMRKPKPRSATPVKKPAPAEVTAKRAVAAPVVLIPNRVAAASKSTYNGDVIALASGTPGLKRQPWPSERFRA